MRVDTETDVGTVTDCMAIWRYWHSSFALIARNAAAGENL